MRTTSPLPILLLISLWSLVPTVHAEEPKSPADAWSIFLEEAEFSSRKDRYIVEEMYRAILLRWATHFRFDEVKLLHQFEIRLPSRPRQIGRPYVVPPRRP